MQLSYILPRELALVKLCFGTTGFSRLMKLHESSILSIQMHQQIPPYPQWASLIQDVPPLSEGIPKTLVVLPGNTTIQSSRLKSYIDRCLDVSRLDALYHSLWFAGRPGNVRPLHRQKMMERRIVVTEQADLHMAWIDDRIYLKPLPPWLVHYEFFVTYICSSGIAPGATNRLFLYEDAVGFLESYVKLIRDESDFRMAIDLGLLVQGIQWKHWSLFAASFESTLQNHPEISVSRRYHFGELRLFRLNLLHRFWLGHWISGYHLQHTNFSSFFGRNFTWPLITFAYVTTILNAMQVVLASELQDIHFRLASFAFGVGTITTILLAFFTVFFLFIGLLLYNLGKALRLRQNTGPWQKDMKSV